MPVISSRDAAPNLVDGEDGLIPQFEAGALNGAAPKPNWWPIRKRLEVAAEWARSPVLDVGAGTGWLTFHLAYWGHNVTACDYSQDARANFKENAAIVGSDLQIAHENVSSLSYPDKSFESLFSISVLPYVGDLQGALSELYRVLRPRGVAVVGCINAYGSYAFINDRDPRTLWRKSRSRVDIRDNAHHFHGPRWWKREFSKRFTVLHVIPVEVFSPLIARVAGYDVDSRWTRADVRLAAHLPKEVASEVLYILRK
jgi:SAM-dependent methyltransferase